jgi:hypothetical protein
VLATSAHVVTEFREKKTGDPSVTMAISRSSQRGVLSINDEWLVDRGNDKLDLAIFRLPEPSRLLLIGKAYFRDKCWPPSKPA